MNSLAAAMDYGARMLVGFIVIPFLVVGLGDFAFGVWTVLKKMSGYVAASGARPTKALKCVIANRQSSDDLDEKRRYVGSAVIVWLLFTPLQGSLAALVAWFAPIWLGVPGEMTWAVRLAAAVLLIGPIVNNLFNIPRSVLEGENLGYKQMGVSALIVIFGGVLTLLALKANTGLVGVAAASLTTVVLTGVLYLVIVRLHVPWFGLRIPDWGMARQFVGLSGWFLVWKLIIKVMMDSDVIILGILASANTVTLYSLTRYAPEMLVNFVGIFVFGITPGLGGIIGKGDLKAAAKVRGEIMLLTWLVLTVVGASILLLNNSFLRLWIGPEYNANSNVTLMILVMAAQLTLIRNDANIIDLTLDIRKKVILGAVAAVATVAISTWMVGFAKAGIAGLCLGFILGRSILSVGYPLLIGRELGISWRSQVSNMVRPAATTIVLTMAVALTGGRVIVDSWVGLVFCVAIASISLFLMSFFIGLSFAQRQQVLRRVRTVAFIRT